MTSNAKLFSHISYHVRSICLLTGSHRSRLLKMSPFLFMSVLTLKKGKMVVKKQINMNLSMTNAKNKVYPGFPRLGISGKSYNFIELLPSA